MKGPMVFPGRSCLQCFLCNVAGRFCGVVFNAFDRAFLFADVLPDRLRRIEIDQLIKHAMCLSQNTNTDFLQKTRHSLSSVRSY